MHIWLPSHEFNIIELLFSAYIHIICHICWIELNIELNWIKFFYFMKYKKREIEYPAFLDLFIFFVFLCYNSKVFIAAKKNVFSFIVIKMLSYNHYVALWTRGILGELTKILLGFRLVNYNNNKDMYMKLQKKIGECGQILEKKTQKVEILNMFRAWHKA